ncbi:MAG TPA: hypothetical protein VHO71_03650 [Caproiciproducens sp.]|nr:hypothetical protein [Caproiciproducens sp.]
MKLLYVGLDTVLGKASETIHRIENQLTGVHQLGNEADAVYCLNRELLFCSKDGVLNYSLPDDRSKQEKFICDQVCRIMQENQYDFLYLKGFLIDHLCLAIASYAKEKCFGIKVIFEESGYPEQAVGKRLLQKFKENNDKESYHFLYRRMLLHSFLIKKFKYFTDAAVVFGFPIDDLWGIPAITVNDGIDFSKTEQRICTEISGDPVSILGVVEQPEVCGFERMILGLKTYLLDSHHEDIVFDIVGEPDSLQELQAVAKSNDLSNRVRFLGKKLPEEMVQLYNTHSVAVSCLGLYKVGEKYYSPEIAKLYCAAGIPFIYAYEDLSLYETIPFALKVTNNDSPINISLVCEFVWRCRLDQRLPQTERKFAEKNYDWRIIMKRILEFTATGRREV